VDILDQIRQLGDPWLRRRAEPVREPGTPAFRARAARLHAALAAFRRQHGFGRAMAAPQLGLGERFIACNLGNGPLTLINPSITWRSAQCFTLWDDCMSFPQLLVRVQRHASVSVQWTDDDGTERHWERLDRATSELLQHEIDHLDGVLAVDRALARDSLVLRPVFEAKPQRFQAMTEDR
jgi:peptide deformylase